MASQANPAGLVAYVDETYSDANEVYVLGAVVVARGAILGVAVSILTERLLPNQLRKPFKWRTAGSGRRKGFIQATVVGHGLTCHGAAKLQVTAATQETARAACLEHLITALVADGVEEVVLDQRDTPGKHALDKRTLGRLRSTGVLPQAVKARFAYPIYEPVLHCADAVAGATQLAAVDPAWVAEFQGLLKQHVVP